MAVQAQNPSSIFLFNRINDQERKTMDCPIQDQSNIFPQQGGGTSITRKRGRDQYSNTLSSATNLPQQGVSTGLRLSFEEEHTQNLRLSAPFSLSSPLPADLAAQIKLQSDEIDMFLHIQGEHLRRTLAESRILHYRVLASAVEESAVRRLREKEAELERASRRNAELEEKVAQLAAEATAWQARARADEAAAAELQARLHRAAVEDAGGSDAESTCADPRREEGGGSLLASCRRCRSAAAMVVALPCRHLCLCPACDSGAAACPVCSCAKSASVEVYWT